MSDNNSVIRILESLWLHPLVKAFMDFCKRQKLSFSKTVEIVVKTAEQDDAPVDRQEQRSGSLKIHSHIHVHQELLESSSKFFHNALRDTIWREAAERRFQSEAPIEVLQVFGNWLYRRDAGIRFAWPLWVDIHLFACEYLIDELAAETIECMRSNLGSKEWTPRVDDIEHIYERTSEDSLLREMLVICLSLSTSSDRPSILRAAPAAFVREFAVHISTNPSRQLKYLDAWPGSTPTKANLSDCLQLDSVIRFQLQDMTQPVFLHADVLCREVNIESIDLNRESGYRVCDTQMIHNSTFRIFASWLYFEDNPCDETHECQTWPNLERLLDCYEACLILAQCKVEELHRANNTCNRGNGHLGEILALQSHRFSKRLIEAVILHCQEREDALSLEEISRVYSITARGDPLRKLMADVYVSKGRQSVTDIAHIEFQRELNARLLERIAQMQEYIDRVQSIVEPYKVAIEAKQTTDLLRRRKRDPFYGFSESELKMKELVDVGDSQLLRIHPSQYNL